MRELTPEMIESLLGKPKSPQETTKPRTKKFIRRETQFAPRNTKHVKWHDTYSPNKTLRCASRGCSAGTCYTLDGVPYCSIHIIFGLSVRLEQAEADVEFYKKGYGEL